MSTDPTGVAADPTYAELARRRSLGPVVVEEVEETPAGPRQWFGVYRWEAVRAALAEEDLSACLYHDEMGLDRRYGEVLLGMDPPGHRAHRAVLQPTFSRGALAGPLRTAVTAPVDDAVAHLVADGAPRRADLVAALCEPLPVRVLAVLLDLPDAFHGPLQDQAVVLLRGDRGRAVAAADALYRRLRPVIRERRRAPVAEDLVSVLAHGEVDGRPLRDEEVFSHLRLLAIAGTDTVTRALGNLLFGLLTTPGQLDALRRDPGLAPLAVEEAVRWECPAVSVPRIARRDLELAGHPVPAGSAVRVVLGAANRDPDRWPDPDRYDLRREPRPNAGFGLGVHSCLGVHLAHTVLEHTVTALSERLPGLELDPGAPRPRIEGTDLRSPPTLPVRWG
ncbi:MAG: cytochrome P450 [Acidimicrobiales bacterium]|nr:cytochrome P450 [Acidimicrobiales bacterium]